MFCHQFDGQVWHAACPFWFWNVPAMQLGHDPVPACPAGHAVHADLAWFTAQPFPLLHDVDVCGLLSCHCACGHAAHTTLAVAEHAAVRLWPWPQPPHALQLPAPAAFCHWPPGQLLHLV